MRKIKRIYCYFFIVLILFTNSINVSAQEAKSESIRTGYLDADTYFEVHRSEMSLYAEDIETIKVTITYDGIITPQSSIAWTEEIDGYVYKGTLNLLSYSYIGNSTHAIYQGMLYRQ